MTDNIYIYIYIYNIFLVVQPHNFRQAWCNDNFDTLLLGGIFS